MLKNKKTLAAAKPAVEPITIDRKALAIIVAGIHKATKDTKDAWRRMISLEISAGYLWVRAGGEHARIEIPIPCKGANLTCTVDSEALHRALRTRFSDTPTLELELANGVLLLRDTEWIGSHRDFAERLLTGMQIPPRLKDARAVGKVNGGNLRHAAEVVNHARSKDASRPYMQGLQVRITSTGLRFLTTDGHRLSVATVPVKWTNPPPTSTDNDLCLSVDAVELLMLTPSIDNMEISVSERGIEIENKDPVRTTRYPGFTFETTTLPDGVMSYTDQVIPPSAPERQVQLDSIAISTLKTAAKAATEQGIDLYFTKEGVHQNPPPIPAVCVRLCARYLLEALEHFALDAIIQYDDDLNPILLRNPRDVGRLEVIMPMRR